MARNGFVFLRGVPDGCIGPGREEGTLDLRLPIDDGMHVTVGADQRFETMDDAGRKIPRCSNIRFDRDDELRVVKIDDEGKWSRQTMQATAIVDSWNKYGAAYAKEAGPRVVLEDVASDRIRPIRAQVNNGARLVQVRVPDPDAVGADGKPADGAFVLPEDCVVPDDGNPGRFRVHIGRERSSLRNYMIPTGELDGNGKLVHRYADRTAGEVLANYGGRPPIGPSKDSRPPEEIRPVDHGAYVKDQAKFETVLEELASAVSDRRNFEPVGMSDPGSAEPDKVVLRNLSSDDVAVDGDTASVRNLGLYFDVPVDCVSSAKNGAGHILHGKTDIALDSDAVLDWHDANGSLIRSVSPEEARVVMEDKRRERALMAYRTIGFGDGTFLYNVDPGRIFGVGNRCAVLIEDVESVPEPGCGKGYGVLLLRDVDVNPMGLIDASDRAYEADSMYDIEAFDAACREMARIQDADTPDKPKEIFTGWSGMDTAYFVRNADGSYRESFRLAEEIGIARPGPFGPDDPNGPRKQQQDRGVAGDKRDIVARDTPYVIVPKLEPGAREIEIFPKSEPGAREIEVFPKPEPGVPAVLYGVSESMIRRRTAGRFDLPVVDVCVPDPESVAAPGNKTGYGSFTVRAGAVRPSAERGKVDIDLGPEAAKLTGYRIRTGTDRDGAGTYEAVDRTAGQVKAQYEAAMSARSRQSRAGEKAAAVSHDEDYVPGM